MDSATMSKLASSSSHFARSSIFSPKSSPKLNKPNFLKSLKCDKKPNPNISSSSLPNRNPTSSVSSSAATVTAPGTSELAVSKLERISSEFRSLTESIDRVRRLLDYASLLPPFDESKRVASNRVMGCTAQVWLDVSMDEFGRMRVSADSDSEITKGFCACLIWILDGASAEEVLELKTEDLATLNIGNPGGAQSRTNTWYNVLISMQKRTKSIVAEREGKPPVDLFPSLVVSADGISAQGSYAEAQNVELQKKQSGYE